MLSNKFAVTGASGFIGRHVLNALADLQIKTIAATRHPERIAIRNNMEVVNFDLSHYAADVYERIGCPNTLIHLAWEGLPNYKSLHHFEEELPRQYEFLKTLIASGLRRLLVVGTCFEYGMQSGSLSESLETKPNNPYSYAKDMLHRHLEYLRQSHSFDYTWARLFYMFGEGQPASSLMPQLQKAVEHGERTFNMSGGEQLRDYLPVAEVARLIVELALRGCSDSTVNVCAGKPISVRRLVETWREDFKWDIEFNFGYYPYPDYEPMAFWGDRTKLDSVLRKKPVHKHE